MRVRRIGVAGAGVPAMMMLIFVLFAGMTDTIHTTKWFWIPLTVCLLLAERRERFGYTDLVTNATRPMRLELAGEHEPG